MESRNSKAMARYNENRIDLASSHHWRLWFSWLLAGMVGEPVAWVAILLTIGPVQDILSRSVWQIGSLLYGILIAIAQSIALRRCVRDFSPPAWILLTALGGAIRWQLLFTYGSANVAVAGNVGPLIGTIFTLSVGVVLGLLTGAMQWFALRRYTSAALWWIPANAIAWILAVPVWLFISNMGAFLLATVLLGGLTSALTGFTLVRMLYTKPAPVTEE